MRYNIVTTLHLSRHRTPVDLQGFHIEVTVQKLFTTISSETCIEHVHNLLHTVPSVLWAKCLHSLGAIQQVVSGMVVLDESTKLLDKRQEQERICANPSQTIGSHCSILSSPCLGFGVSGKEDVWECQRQSPLSTGELYYEFWFLHGLRL